MFAYNYILIAADQWERERKQLNRKPTKPMKHQQVATDAMISEGTCDTQNDPERIGRLAYARFHATIGTHLSRDAWDVLDDPQKAAWIAAGSAGLPVSQ